MDHINVKLFAEPGSGVEFSTLIPVFHRWIREKALPGTLIDVADYGHVPEGPGVLLIAHDAFYSVDNRASQLGFLYNRRTSEDGDTAGKIRGAFERAVEGARLLESESAVGLRFNEQEFEVFVNDRALAPNTDETEAAVRPLVEALYREKFGISPKIERDSTDPRSLFRLRVRPAE